MGCLSGAVLGGDGARVFLHLDGRMQGGVQFGVLVLLVLWDAVCGELFEKAGAGAGAFWRYWRSGDIGHACDGAGVCLHLDWRVQGGHAA